MADTKLNSTRWRANTWAARRVTRSIYGRMDGAERRQVEGNKNNNNDNRKTKKKGNLWRRRDDGGLGCDWRDWDHRDYGRGGRGGLGLLNNSMVRGQRLDTHRAAQMNSRRTSGGRMEEGVSMLTDRCCDQCVLDFIVLMRRPGGVWHTGEGGRGSERSANHRKALCDWQITWHFCFLDNPDVTNSAHLLLRED